MAITALPALNRTASTFRDDVDTFFGTQLPAFSVEAEAARVEINNNTITATTQAQLATTQAQLATTQATAAAASALSAGATIWVSGTTYTAGVSKYSPLDGQVYRRMITGAGTTDPSLDAVNWRVVNGLTSELIVLPFNNLPAVRPSLNLDFANNQSVDPRITFTRASVATRTNSKGLIEVVASGVPRIDYDAVTGACKGLLIEEQRANLLTYSEQFDNAAWVKSAVTVTANAVSAPDGTVTADKLIESATNASHQIKEFQTTTNSAPLTLSIFAKADTKTSIILLLQEATTFARYSWASFDLTSGSAGVVSNVGGASLSSASIQPVGGGWYRCALTSTIGGTDPNIAACYQPGTSLVAYTGDGTSGLYIWGAQLEAGAFPTSYIPTVASQVTRAADVAMMTGANFSSWYRADEGSLFVSGASGDTRTSDGMYAAVLSGGSINDEIALSRRITSLLATGDVRSGGVAQADMFSSIWAVNSLGAATIAYKTNDFALAFNGSVAATDASGTVPVVQELWLGRRRNGLNYWNGHIRSLSYYPKRLTNAELQALSTQ